ncbi:MAG: hypothetical protein R8M45_03730 [Ghiorsea sp.]
MTENINMVDEYTFKGKTVRILTIDRETEEGYHVVFLAYEREGKESLNIATLYGMVFYDDNRLVKVPNLRDLPVDTEVVVWDIYGKTFNRHLKNVNPDGTIVCWHAGCTCWSDYDPGNGETWAHGRLATEVDL